MWDFHQESFPLPRVKPVGDLARAGARSSGGSSRDPPRRRRGCGLAFTRGAVTCVVQCLLTTTHDDVNVCLSLTAPHPRVRPRHGPRSGVPACR